MKRILLISLLALALVFALASCNNKDSGDDSSSDNGNNNSADNTENSGTADGSTGDGDNDNDYDEKAYSKGLKFISNGDGTCYVRGIGTCTDTEIKIPPRSPNGDKVMGIGEWAFSDCNSLTSAVIPDSVTSIGEYAFYSCNNLSSVVIGDSVTSIGDYAFWGCDGLTDITVSSKNAAYQSIDGNLYTKDGKTLVQYAIGKTDTSFTIPNSVTSIGDEAFSGCESLTSITIPDSVTSIDAWAFYACYSLTDIYYTGSEEEWAVILIDFGNNCFANATIHFNYTGEENA